MKPTSTHPHPNPTLEGEGSKAHGPTLGGEEIYINQ